MRKSQLPNTKFTLCTCHKLCLGPLIISRGSPNLKLVAIKLVKTIGWHEKQDVLSHMALCQDLGMWGWTGLSIFSPTYLNTCIAETIWELKGKILKGWLPLTTIVSILVYYVWTAFDLLIFFFYNCVQGECYFKSNVEWWVLLLYMFSFLHLSKVFIFIFENIYLPCRIIFFLIARYGIKHRNKLFWKKF